MTNVFWCLLSFSQLLSYSYQSRMYYWIINSIFQIMDCRSFKLLTIKKLFSNCSLNFLNSSWTFWQSFHRINEIVIVKKHPTFQVVAALSRAQPLVVLILVLSLPRVRRRDKEISGHAAYGKLSYFYQCSSHPIISLFSNACWLLPAALICSNDFYQSSPSILPATSWSREAPGDSTLLCLELPVTLGSSPANRYCKGLHQLYNGQLLAVLLRSWICWLVNTTDSIWIVSLSVCCQSSFFVCLDC